MVTPVWQEPITVQRRTYKVIHGVINAGVGMEYIYLHVGHSPLDTGGHGICSVWYTSMLSLNLWCTNNTGRYTSRKWLPYTDYAPQNRVGLFVGYQFMLVLQVSICLIWIPIQISCTL